VHHDGLSSGESYPQTKKTTIMLNSALSIVFESERMGVKIVLRLSVTTRIVFYSKEISQLGIQILLRGPRTVNKWISEAGKEVGK
jgi:hypothetical protein